jgi:alpha-beta hydrolase superfamily lysophospholipase
MELTFKSVTSCQLQGQLWGEPEKARALVVLAHGLGEHVRRYDHVAQRFVDRGYALLGFDQQGHGKTAGKRGVISGGDGLIRDLESAVLLARKMADGKPVYLYGHSMGAVEVLYYGLKGEAAVDGIMATSPALDENSLSKSQKALISVLKKILPNLAVDNGLALEALSRDAEVVKAYRDDPLVHPKASVRLAAFINDAAAYVREHAQDWQLPLYLAHGSADSICPIAAVEKFAAQLGEKVTFRRWQGLYHETHNEPEKDMVITAMLDWLDALTETSC